MRFLLPFLSFLALASCQKKEQRGPEEPRFARISFHTEVRSLDPRTGIDSPSNFAIGMLFEGLMRTAPDGRVEPAVAKSYVISDNHTTLTFTLRDTYWTNGDPVTAHDFVYSWTQIIDPTKGSNLGVQGFYPIKNVQAIARGEKPVESAGIAALDDMTLQVELEHPTPYFLDALTTTSFFPVNSKVDQSTPRWASQQGDGFICNGPFQLEHHKINNELVVVRNPTYWDAAHVKLPGIHIAIIKDITTQLSLFEKKQLDWLGMPLSKFPLDAIEHLKKKGQIRFFDTLGICWFFVNVESFPFHNKKMRKAFAYAIDRDSLTKFVTQGKEVPAMGILPKRIAVQNHPHFEDNNLEMAQQLFDEALAEMGLTKETLPPITVNCADAIIRQRMSEALQQQWARAFGIDIQLEKQEWKVLYDNLQTGNYQLGMMCWQSWVRDPIYLMQTFRDKSDGVNMSHWENSTYNSLLSLAEKEADLQVRSSYFKQAETLLMEEMPVIPLFFTTVIFAKNPLLKNVYISEVYDVDFRWAYFKEDSTRKKAHKTRSKCKLR